MRTITVSEEDGLEIVKKQVSRLLNGSTLLRELFEKAPDYAKAKSIIANFKKILDDVTRNVDELSK